MKYVEIIGPCSKYIDGKGWVTQIPEHLLEAQGFRKIDVRLLNVIKHCLHRHNTEYNCENCVKGPEQDIMITCRSVLKEIVELYEEKED